MASLTDQALKVHEWIKTGQARQMRVDAGISLATAGRDCDTDPSAVLRWERGERFPRGRNVRAYYRLLTRLQAATAGEPAA